VVITTLFGENRGNQRVPYVLKNVAFFSLLKKTSFNIDFEISPSLGLFEGFSVGALIHSIFYEVIEVRTLQWRAN
jgi:hypothetical protein